eukprot:COSAG02_NODE_38367_length_429_cov_11.124242_1_plen_73_part_10
MGQKPKFDFIPKDQYSCTCSHSTTFQYSSTVLYSYVPYCVHYGTGTAILKCTVLYLYCILYDVEWQNLPSDLE